MSFSVGIPLVILTKETYRRLEVDSPNTSSILLENPTSSNSYQTLWISPTFFPKSWKKYLHFIIFLIWSEHIPLHGFGKEKKRKKDDFFKNHDKKYLHYIMYLSIIWYCNTLYIHPKKLLLYHTMYIFFVLNLLNKELCFST